MIEVDSSSSSKTQCLVKSRYRGSWEKRQIEIDLDQGKLYLILGNEKKKEFPLNTVTMRQDSKNNLIFLRVSKKREYEIQETKQIDERLQEISIFKNSQFFINKVPEMKFPIPKKLNYFAPLRSHSFQEGYIPLRSSMSMTAAKNLSDFQRKPTYYNSEDWRIDEKNGGVLLVNEIKKAMVSKIIKYVCKRVLTTGSFMGISFPTFSMKPESMLMTYCRCLGVAPLILDKVSFDPVERIKAFNAIILTLSFQFNDIDKPFNPTIGETFQGEIGGYQIYAEQISHHPPISSFLLDGKNYVLHGSLELNAQLSLNSAIGMFYGEISLEFDDGGVVKGRMPCGKMSNVLIGDTHFGPTGACFSYDPLNQLICSYQVKKNDIIEGFIGKLKEKAYNKFIYSLKEKSVNRYENFKNIPEKDFEKIESQMSAKWTQYIKYDGEQFIDYSEKQWWPIIMTQKIMGEQILDSDSNHRLDIKLRKEEKIDESQQQKQRIEEEERRLRKLREQRSKVY